MSAIMICSSREICRVDLGLEETQHRHGSGHRGSRRSDQDRAATKLSAGTERLGESEAPLSFGFGLISVSLLSSVRSFSPLQTNLGPWRFPFQTCNPILYQHDRFLDAL